MMSAYFRQLTNAKSNSSAGTYCITLTPTNGGLLQFNDGGAVLTHKKTSLNQRRASLIFFIVRTLEARPRQNCTTFDVNNEHIQCFSNLKV